jgi:hypothetical protein
MRYLALRVENLILVNNPLYANAAVGFQWRGREYVDGRSTERAMVAPRCLREPGYKTLHSANAVAENQRSSDTARAGTSTGVAIVNEWRDITNTRRMAA